MPTDQAPDRGAPGRDRPPGNDLDDEPGGDDGQLHGYPGRKRTFTATSAVNAVTTAR